MLRNNQNIYKNTLLSYDVSSTLDAVKPLESLKTRGGALPYSFKNGKFLLASKQTIVVTPDMRFAYTVNQENNTIAGFEIDKKGNWNIMKGSPFFSRGVSPHSLVILYSNILVVTNSNVVSKTRELANYVTFKIDSKTGVPHFLEKKDIRKNFHASKLVSCNVHLGMFLSIENSNRFFEISKRTLLKSSVQGASILSVFSISSEGVFLNVSSVPLTTSIKDSFVKLVYAPIDFVVHPTETLAYISSSMHMVPLVYSYDNQGMIHTEYSPYVDTQKRIPKMLLSNLQVDLKKSHLYALSVSLLEYSYAKIKDINSGDLVLFDLANSVKPVFEKSFSFNDILEDENVHNVFYEFLLHPESSKMFLLQNVISYNKVNHSFLHENTYLNIITLKNSSIILLQQHLLFDDLQDLESVGLPSGLYLFNR